jgi:acetyl esterase/lipase
MRVIFFSAALMLAGIGFASAGDPKLPKGSPTYDVEERKGVVYRDLHPAEKALLGWNKLDLYLPRKAKDFPMVVLVHGGAWVVGDKTLDSIPEVAACLAGQGIAVAAPNYRLAPAFKHPAHVRDVAKAFAWTKKHIADYGGRADQIFLFGHSAGGHLVSLLATDEAYLKQENLRRSDIKGVISASGVYQISDLDLKFLIKNSSLKLDLALDINPFTMVFGNGDGAKKASPLTYVQAGLPPFLVMCAEEDWPTLPEMAKKFDAALKAKKCDTQLLKIRGRNHLTMLWEATRAYDPLIRAVVDFVHEKGKAPKGAP